MVKIKKALMLSPVLAALLLVFITGCPAPETTTPTVATTTPPATTQTSSPFTPEELQQIVTDSKLATVNAVTYKLDLDATTVISIDDSAQTSGMTMKAQITFDIPQKQMLMDAEITSSEADSGTQTQAVEIYVLADYVYMKASAPDFGEQWIKMPVTQEILDSFNISMMQEEMDVMELPAAIEFVEYATIRGIDCYVLKIAPSEDYLREYAQSQMSGGFEIDWDKAGDVADVYKQLSYLVWIAKDTKYIHRMEITGVQEFTSDFARSDAIDFDKATTETSGILEIYDYNSPVAIDLPAEAEDAIEISPDMFSGQ